MFFINAYRAHRLEKKRERLLKEAHARRASERGHAGREHRHDHHEQQDRRQPVTRSKTAPTGGRHGSRHQRDHNPFATDSFERLPAWLERANDGHDFEQVRYGNVRQHATHQQREVRHQNSDRAMPDIQPPFPRRVDSLPKREGPANYHPRHGHRYLRPDEHMRPEVLEYVQPLSYGRRGPGETNGYRGRLFHEGGRRPSRPPPRAERAPQWAGPRPDGWI